MSCGLVETDFGSVQMYIMLTVSFTDMNWVKDSTGGSMYQALRLEGDLLGNSVKHENWFIVIFLSSTFFTVMFQTIEPLPT